jgi:hypothetical protein
MNIVDFDVYFSDLNKDAQKRLMKALNIKSPGERNWDRDWLPLFTLEFIEAEDDGLGNIEWELPGEKDV